MKNQRAFALRDALVGTTVLAGLAVLTVPAISQVRMDSMRQVCVGNNRFIASASSSYINDHGGKMWALSWKAGMQNPTVPNVQYFASDSEAQGYEAVLIYRRMFGLTATEAPIPQNWFPQILNAHAALLEYVNLPIPASYMVCPADFTRQNYLEEIYKPFPVSGGDNTATTWRWIFSSTYKWDVYQWSPSRSYRTLNPRGQNVQCAMPANLPSTTELWTVEGDTTVQGAWGPKQATDVHFPSQKVFLSDDYARHNGQTRYYADQAAGQDLLFHDGSVRYYRADSTNPGWDPRTKTTRGNMTGRFAFTKQADVFGSLYNGAKSANYTAGWYRWTRGGLQGWDVPRTASMVGKLPSPSVIENEVDTSAATGVW